MRFVKTCGALMPADQESIAWWMQIPEGVELEVTAIPNQRTHRQNNAIHAWLTELAKNLNAAGFDMLTFPWREGVEIPWSLDLAKDKLWRPVQEAVTGKRRTSELTTAEVDQVYQPLARKIAGMGVEVPPLGRE